jgi:flagellar hook-basal body complex protein FliE
MPIEALPLAPLPRLAPLAAPQPQQAAGTPASGFAQVLNGMLTGQTQANAAADDAVRALATGEAQDLHTVSLAVAQADLAFRMVLELRNRLSDAFQEVSRMQV